MYPDPIPHALRKLQAKRKWNQTQMGEALGIYRNHYSDVLHGRRRLPYEAACRAFKLGVSAKILLSLDNIQKP